MIGSFLDWFKKTPQNNTEESNSCPTQRAAAALMVEVSLADTSFNNLEEDKLINLLKDQTGLTTQECLELLAIAHNEVDHATSLHQFTRHLNEVFDLNEKLDLVHSLWHIAYADGHLDKYEEHIIRKVADLLHLRHSEYIQMKIKAQNA